MTGKAKILRVGIFHTQYESPSLGIKTATKPLGWCFDCKEGIPAMEVRDGVTRWGGWTLDELHEVASRPSEFVEMEAL
jgi:hypothetical protein